MSISKPFPPCWGQLLSLQSINNISNIGVDCRLGLLRVMRARFTVCSWHGCLVFL